MALQLDLFNQANTPKTHTCKVIDADHILFDGTEIKWFFAFNYHDKRKYGIKKLTNLSNKKCRSCWLYGFIGSEGLAQDCTQFGCNRRNGDCGFYSIREMPNY